VTAAGLDISLAIFQRSEAGTTNLEHVMFGVSHGVVVAVYGFIVSLGSLIAYGLLSRQADRLEVGMDDYADELLAVYLNSGTGKKAGSRLSGVSGKSGRTRGREKSRLKAVLRTGWPRTGCPQLPEAGHGPQKPAPREVLK
jgi:hypothetical protein